MYPNLLILIMKRESSEKMKNTTLRRIITKVAEESNRIHKRVSMGMGVNEKKEEAMKYIMPMILDML